MTNRPIVESSKKLTMYLRTNNTNDTNSRHDTVVYVTLYSDKTQEL